MKMRNKMKEFKYITQHTRAGKNGKEIICPKCDGKDIVYHFNFSALMCNKCKKFSDKYAYKIEV
jgi:ribosomal protein L37AE/L43A